MVLDTPLLNTQLYKVRIIGKVKQSRERSSVLHLGVVSTEKGVFESPSTTVANLTFFLLTALDRNYEISFFRGYFFCKICFESYLFVYLLLNAVN